MISRRFIANSVIYTFSGALPLASAVVLLPFYVAHLSNEKYGALAIVYAASMLAQLVAGFSFDSSLYVHYHEWRKEPGRLVALVRTAFLLVVCTGCVLVLLSVLAGDYLLQAWVQTSSFSFYPYGLMGVAMGALQAVFKLHTIILQIREKAETYFWSNALFFFITTVGTIIGLYWFPDSLAGPVGARLLGALMLAGWSVMRVVREFGLPDFRSVSMLPWKYNLSTFGYQVANWAVNYLDRFLILAFMPVAAVGSVGVYEFAIKCLIPLELLLNGLQASLSPRVIKLLSEQPAGSTPEMNRYFYGLLAVMMLAISAMLLVLPPAFMLLVHKPGYKQALDYVPYMAVLYLFRSWRLFFAIPLSALKKTGRLAFITLVVAAVKAGGIAFLLPRYELYGVVAAAFAAGVAELVLLWVVLRPVFNLEFNYVKLLLAPYAFGTAAVMLYAFGIFEVWWLAAGATVLLAVVLLAAAYRREWHLVAGQWRGKFL